MRADIVPAPWIVDASPFFDNVDCAIFGTWSDAAVAFWAERSAKLALGQRPPSGAQPFLNRAVHAAFVEAGWDGDGGRYVRDGDWIRVTFRHQMSLGSDLLDAQKVIARGYADRVLILAAGLDFLRTITPNDANVIITYEKLWNEILDLDGVLGIPLYVGRLEAASALPDDVATFVKGPRRRPSVGNN